MESFAESSNLQEDSDCSVDSQGYDKKDPYAAAAK